MRKIVNIILCLCIMVATFDIVDVHDITLNGKKVFHSQSASQNQDNDSLETDHFNTIAKASFNAFPAVAHIVYISYRTFDSFTITDDPEYNNYISSLYRPPIA